MNDCQERPNGNHRRGYARGPGLALALSVVLGGAAEARAQEQPPRHEMHDAHHGDVAEAEAAVGAVLDELHAAAAAADYDRYFGIFTDDAVFLGTDATERWTLEQFQEYAGARFSQGNGWTYRMLERHVTISPHGHAAWFDERLHNERYGETRGTGVLVHSEDGWKIAQYNLTIPVPNDLALEFVERIRETTGQ